MNPIYMEPGTELWLESLYDTNRLMKDLQGCNVSAREVSTLVDDKQKLKKNVVMNIKNAPLIEHLRKVRQTKKRYWIAEGCYNDAIQKIGYLKCEVTSGKKAIKEIAHIGKKIGAEIDKYFQPEPEPEVQIEPFWLSFLGLFFILIFRCISEIFS